MNKKFLSVILFGALLASSAGTFTSCKDYDDDINGLQEQIDANKKTLDEKSAALQTALDAANQEIAAAKAAAAAAQTTADKAAQAAAAAKEAAAQAKADAIAEAQRLVNELKLVVDKKVDQTVYDAKMTKIDAEIGVINGTLTDFATADAAMQQQIDALNLFMAKIEVLKLDTEFPALKEQVAGLVTDLNALKSRVATNELAIDELKTELGTLSGRIDAVQSGLNTLNALLSHRLTALTFAPSFFVNGIESVNFSTLEYKPWKNVLADNTDGTKTTTINDGKTTAYYYVNPSSVSEDDIDVSKLSILVQEATNTITRATVDPITVTDISIKNGKMAVSLKKNIEESFNKENTTVDGNTVEHFTLIALKAEVEQTADEIKADIKPVVTSDWARLTENSAQPFIHNADKQYNEDQAEDLTSTPNVIPHFYPYSALHSVAGKIVAPDAVCDTQGKGIVKEVSYLNTTLNLNDLVAICDKDGHFYNADDYGLKFEFKLVDYYLKANNEEKTNQANYAKISEDGIITSCANNGEALNRDAIGREPLVQVILRNTANNDVVDVRYFKIAWSAERTYKELAELENMADNFACGASYDVIVGTDAMNDLIYTVARPGGYDKDEFHRLFTLDNKVYASFDDAKAGTAATSLGTVKQIEASGSQHTYNLKWAFDIADNNITAAEYEAGQAVRTVYGRYYSIDAYESENYIFSITLTLKINKMGFVAGYNSTYWNEGAAMLPTNAAKIFQVNPALTSDKIYGIDLFFDCQIIADLLNGYNMAGIAPAALKIEDLVSNENSVKFAFDAKRLNEVFGAQEGPKWSVSVDGQSLIKGNVTAATIDGTIIRLYESKLPTKTEHGEATTTAQELLGKNIPVKLVSTFCTGLSVELDHFLVNFINPLKMTLGEIKDSFHDLTVGGSNINVEKIATIKEAFGINPQIVWADGVAKNATLVQWYNVNGVTWDITKATTNLKLNGNTIDITNDVTASNWSDFENSYELTASPSNTGAKTLTFNNKNGAHLGRAFKIAVPVYVQTKWNPALSDPEQMIVELTVNP